MGLLTKPVFLCVLKYLVLITIYNYLPLILVAYISNLLISFICLLFLFGLCSIAFSLEPVRTT